jgi:hypothetical protein
MNRTSTFIRSGDADSASEAYRGRGAVHLSPRLGQRRLPPGGTTQARPVLREHRYPTCGRLNPGARTAAATSLRRSSLSFG